MLGGKIIIFANEQALTINLTPFECCSQVLPQFWLIMELQGVNMKLGISLLLLIIFYIIIQVSVSSLTRLELLCFC